VGQSIGNSAIQTIEFGPAHFHGDIVGTDGWIRDEIQLDQIALQDRRTAYRSIDYSFSHDDISRAMIERHAVTNVTSQRRMDWKSALRITPTQT
jgi:hypothetical protein